MVKIRDSQGALTKILTIFLEFKIIWFKKKKIIGIRIE
jgi:hypothetical protein